MSYIQGFVTPVPIAKRTTYRDLAAKAAPVFKELGAEQVVECWGEDVPDGKVTDFKRAVQATGDEAVVFSWIVWPDKATCDAAGPRMMTDERLRPGPEGLPFDTGRMIYGGFVPLFDTKA